MAKVATVALGLDPSGAVAGAGTFAGAMKGVGASAAAAGTKVNSLGRSMKLMAGGLIGLLVIRDLVKTLVDFNKTMREVKVVTRATTEEMVKMEAVARKLGAVTRFTATEAGEGMLFLSRAGFSVNSVMEMIPRTLDLATAASIGLGEASDMVANTMNQFGMRAWETERAVDALLIVANSTNTNVLQMGEGMKYAGTFAGVLGISLEETAAALGMMANMGIKGSMAGTQMRGVMAALIRPTDKAAAAIARLGINADDVNPALHSLEDIFRTFAKAEANMADKTEFAGEMRLLAYLQSIS